MIKNFKTFINENEDYSQQINDLLNTKLLSNLELAFQLCEGLKINLKKIEDIKQIENVLIQDRYVRFGNDQFLIDNPLKNLPTFLNYLNNLKRLSVLNNSITDFSNDFKNLNSLSLIDLDLKNFSFDNFLNIKDLSLEGCNNIPFVSLINLHNLEDLNLRNLDFEEDPKEIYNFKNLKVLLFTGCKKMKSISPLISNLKNLTDLYLSGCSLLEELPEKEILSLTKLKCLKLTCSWFLDYSFLKTHINYDSENNLKGLSNALNSNFVMSGKII